MTAIDWNDPDFCKTYKYRNGTKILAVYTLPNLFHALTDYRHATTDGSRIYRHLDSGRICNSYSENGFDIVQIPREPRHGEGWVRIYSDGNISGTCKSRVGELSTKIKWEEVIE